MHITYNTNKDRDLIIEKIITFLNAAGDSAIEMICNEAVTFFKKDTFSDFTYVTAQVFDSKSKNINEIIQFLLGKSGDVLCSGLYVIKGDVVIFSSENMLEIHSPKNIDGANTAKSRIYSF